MDGINSEQELFPNLTTFNSSLLPKPRVGFGALFLLAKI